MLKLTSVFPAVDDVFVNVLAERIVANGFTDERLRDAISHLIDNFRYQRPNVADVISFDRRIKIYSYSDYTNEILSKKARGDDFAQHWIDGKLFFVKIADCKQYNFKPNEKKE